MFFAATLVFKEVLHLVCRSKFRVETSAQQQINRIGSVQDWKTALDILDFAYQPIVNAHTGMTYGFEALLRNTQDAGFSSIDAVFDEAYASGNLVEVEKALREKAVAKFTQSKLHHHTHLFYNLDNRILELTDYNTAATLALLKRYGLENRLCFEISEKHQLHYDGDSLEKLRTYRKAGLSIAIDDYGTGFSGLQLLYHTEPNYIKIDRFFIQDIATDLKKKHLVTSLLQSAHLLGSLVVAEGVETEREFYECVAVGCDLIQGFLVQHPRMDLSEMKLQYPLTQRSSPSNRRGVKSDRSLLESRIEFVDAVPIGMSIIEVFSKFQNGSHPFIPVVNALGEPIGIVHEANFKRYAYSRFGRELLQNTSHREPLEKFVQAVPIVDCHTPAEQILEIYSLSRSMDCLLVTDQMHYIGFLSAPSLLNVLHEKNLILARDQNPLTRLPGNTIIFEYVSEALQHIEENYVLAYFDFDRFKPFNDRYGFRQGDRVILLFAKIISELSHADLVAHIGGDDFFLGYRGSTMHEVEQTIRELLAKFKSDVESFYDKKDLDNGFILSKDRDSQEPRHFPLLTASVAVLELSTPRECLSHEVISTWMAEGKKRAKETAKNLFYKKYPAATDPVPSVNTSDAR